MTMRFLERELEAFRGRWRSGDPNVVDEFTDEFGESLRRIVRRLLRTGRLPRSLRSAPADKRSALASSREVGRVGAAVHRFAILLLSWGGVEVARDTAQEGGISTREFSPDSAKRQPLG